MFFVIKPQAITVLTKTTVVFRVKEMVRRMPPFVQSHTISTGSTVALLGNKDIRTVCIIHNLTVSLYIPIPQ